MPIARPVVASIARRAIRKAKRSTAAVASSHNGNTSGPIPSNTISSIAMAANGLTISTVDQFLTTT